MKVFNIILSILVLILALALAVSSYFLYEKREIMVNGWNQLSSAISQTATILDKSETSDAKKLNAAALSHTNYSSLKQNLEILTNTANAVSSQRDQYVATLQEIGRTVGMSNVPTSDTLVDIAQSSEASSKINSSVNEFKRTHDGLISSINRIASTAGVKINTNELQNGNSNNALKPLSDKIAFMKSQLTNYANANKELSQYVGVAYSDPKTIEESKKMLDAMKRAMQKLKADYNTSQNNLKTANNKIKSLEATIKGRDSKISNLNDTISNTVAENNTLKVMIGMENENIVTPWADGSVEARKVLTGEISEVNKKFGFAIVNIGTTTKVKQRLGNKIGLIDPQITKGLKFNVVRGLNSPDIKVIATDVVATEVADQCTILELNGDDIDNVKVGDSVIVNFVN